MTTTSSAQTGCPTFASELKRLRTARGLSQSELGRRTLTVASYIFRLENGTRQPSREMINRLIYALDVTPEERMALVTAAFLPPDLVAVPISSCEVLS